jgi:hypothetical protein
MIKSKHNTIGFWTLSLITSLLWLFYLLGLSKYFFGFGITFITRSDLSILWIPPLFWCLILSAQVKNITINLSTKTITFQNIFTRKSNIYLFSDFEGYIDTTIPHSNFYSDKAIGLIKDKKVIRRIESYYCSNYNELRNALQEMENLGNIKFNFFKRVKMFLKYPIL